MRWMLLASLMSLLLYAKPAADPSSSPSFDCQSELAGLKALPTLPQEPNAWLEAVDAWRLPARNRLLEAYVYNDAAEDPASRKAACRCIIDLSKAFEKHTKALRLEARKLLPKAQGLEARALKAWAGSDKALKSPEYRAVNDKARSLSQRFRGNIDKFEGSYAVPAQCRDGLPKKWQKAIPLRGGAVLAALKDVKPRCQQDLFVAYVSRLKASNQSVLTDLLAVRQQQAELDGYKNYADQRLAKTQLGDGEAVWRYLDKLSKSNKAASDVERQRRGDKPFWQLSQDTAKEEPQDYQPKQVIDGYFAWLGQQLGVTFKPSRPAFHWAEDISAYSLEKDGKALGILYLDLYPRDGKYCHNRHREFKRGVDGVQLPASVLVMNLPRDKWQHKHLKSLMHESGHALNNLLASQPYEILSGIRLPLDLVEVPAKVLERLAWDPKVHKAITGIARTPAPDNRQSGIALDERILKSAMALAYHQSGKPDMEAINAELYQKYLHQAYIPGLSPQYTFRHLASYGPAYFTYLYSDAEAADISDAIQQGQLSLAQFADCMLKPGGSIPARDQLACATTVDQGAPRHTSVLTPLLLALTTPALAANPIQVPTAEEASTGIQQQLEHHLYQLPPRVQGHYGIRLWRLTGDKLYLNSALYDLYVVSDRLEAISRGLTQPGFVADYSRRLVEGQPNTERGRLRAKSVKSREKYLFYADELLRYMSRLDELGFSHPSDPYFRKILKNYAFKPVVTDRVMIRAWAAQLANHVWWLHQLGITDLCKDFVEAFKATYPDDKDDQLSDQQFENKIYGLTHIVFADSEYYQRNPDAKKYKWISDYLAKHMDEILERTKPDVYAEVGIVFELLGLEDSPVLAQAKRAVLAAIDPKHQVILSEQGNPDLALGAHRNVLAWMLLNWPKKLHRGPLLGHYKALREDLPLSVNPLPKKDKQ